MFQHLPHRTARGVFAVFAIGFAILANQGRCVTITLEYTVADVSTLGNWGTYGNGNGTWAFDINNNGDIVGNSPLGAFIYTNGQMQPLGNGLIEAYSINDSGTVTGKTNSGGFVYSSGTTTSLPSQGWAVNGSGVVVGTNNNQAAILSGGTPTYIELSSHDSSANGINDSGVIVGTLSASVGSPDRGFIYNNGTTTLLGTLGGTSSQATAINNGGLVVGQSYTSLGAGYAHAFLYNGSTMVDLGTLGGPESRALAINSDGTIVGYSDTFWPSGYPGNPTSSSARGAFVYTNGVLQDLNEVTDLSNSPFSILNEAWAINDSGQIVGVGQTSGGQQRAFLLTPIGLTPVPEPATWGIIASVPLLALAMWRIRRRARSLSATGEQE
jgi:probable HAF family extracellular repeat protein